MYIYSLQELFSTNIDIKILKLTNLSFVVIYLQVNNLLHMYKVYVNADSYSH